MCQAILHINRRNFPEGYLLHILLDDFVRSSQFRNVNVGFHIGNINIPIKNKAFRSAIDPQRIPSQVPAAGTKVYERKKAKKQEAEFG